MSKQQKPSAPPYPTMTQSSTAPFHDRNVPGMPPPPPSYEEAMRHPVPHQYNVPNQQGYPLPPPQPFYPPNQSYGQVPYGYGYGAPNPPSQMPYVQQPSATVVVPHAFDAGARFDGVSQPRIPPPPPGIAPNMAQMAAQQGHKVVLGQKPDSWLAGGSSGGTTFW